MLTPPESQWARIVYDYVNDKVYFSASHYTPFTMQFDTSGFFPKATGVKTENGYKNQTPPNLSNPFVFVMP